ncbi:hypothetical protein CR513_56740, partial [Mucuna pruriens]
MSLTMYLFLSLLLMVPLKGTAENSSLHEVLLRHGLPAGLFPQSIKSYNLDQTGHLEVRLDSPCLAQYETRVFFDSVVRANISFGQLKVLDGMSREELFLWLPVKDILVSDPSSGLILIDIGLAYKHLSLSRFEDPPICRSQLVQVFCVRLVEGRVLDLKIRDERLLVWLGMASYFLFSDLVSLFWVSVFPRKICVKKCANPKYIMPSQ